MRLQKQYAVWTLLKECYRIIKCSSFKLFMTNRKRGLRLHGDINLALTFHDRKWHLNLDPTMKLKQTIPFAKSCLKKETMPQESIAHWLSNKWSQFKILFTVRIICTFDNKIKWNNENLWVFFSDYTFCCLGWAFKWNKNKGVNGSFSSISCRVNRKCDPVKT